jgi:predicted RNase H-like nuclease
VNALLAIGADGARGGWLTARGYGDQTGEVTRVALRLARTFDELVALRDGDAPAAVDIPMGLLESVDPRPCDKQARSILGTRANAVFAPPSRPLLAAATYADARDLVAATKLKTPDAKGLSAQAFGIAPKMRDVDEYLRSHAGAQAWLWECHPELSFLTLAKGEVLRDKKSVSGQARRLELITERFPGILDEFVAFEESSRAAELPDALDALVALVTALRVRSGEYKQLGGETDAAGLVMRMVY